MLLRDFGTTGLKVSAVGLGCNNFAIRLDRTATRAVVHEALGARRRDVVVVTKFGLPMDDSGARQGGSRRYVMEAVEASLRRLNTEWIDVYYLHRPDAKTPIGETLAALDELVRAGKVRHIGCSNFSAAQIDAAQEVARRKALPAFATAQD